MNLLCFTIILIFSSIHSIEPSLDLKSKINFNIDTVIFDLESYDVLTHHSQKSECFKKTVADLSENCKQISEITKIIVIFYYFNFFIFF